MWSKGGWLPVVPSNQFFKIVVRLQSVYSVSLGLLM